MSRDVAPSEASSDRTLNEADEEQKYELVTPPPHEQYELPAVSSNNIEKRPSAKTDADLDPFLVTWESLDDRDNPLTWSNTKRWILVGNAGLLLLNSTFATSAPAGIIGDMRAEFGFSQEVGTLTISLFLVGYCLGPIVFGPASERWGRKLIYLVAYIPFVLFQIGCALSKNTETMLILRLLSGCFAACPQSVAGAQISDVTTAKERGIAFVLFTLAPCSGPALGPIVSGFLSVSGVSWRVLYWILFGFSAACTIIICFTPETYGPYILTKRAQRKRKETRDERYYSALEKSTRDMSAGQLAFKLVASPFVMMAQEPLLLLTSIYVAFVYGCLYMLFESLPFIFIDNHHFNLGEEGLTFLGLPVGGIIYGITVLIFWNPRYVQQVEKVHPRKIAPEVRLEVCCVSGPIFASAFFIIGWTSSPNLIWVGPIIGVALIGMFSTSLMLGFIAYTVDVYLSKAATALSAQIILRSLLGAAFPLFSTQMYERLGVPWASTLVGCIAVLLMPIPFLFYTYGKRLRLMSKSATVLD